MACKKVNIWFLWFKLTVRWYKINKKDLKVSQQQHTQKEKSKRTEEERIEKETETVLERWGEYFGSYQKALFQS